MGDYDLKSLSVTGRIGAGLWLTSLMIFIVMPVMNMLLSSVMCSYIKQRSSSTERMRRLLGGDSGKLPLTGPRLRRDVGRNIPRCAVQAKKRKNILCLLRHLSFLPNSLRVFFLFLFFGFSVFMLFSCEVIWFLCKISCGNLYVSCKISRGHILPLRGWRRRPTPELTWVGAVRGVLAKAGVRVLWCLSHA